MGLKENDPESAQLAWAEFFERHWRYLLGVCRGSYGLSLGDLGVEDLVKDTFIRVYQKAATFTPAVTGGVDVRRQRVRAWLGKVANRLFLASWRQECRVISIDELIAEGIEPAVREGADPEDHPSNPRLELVRLALATLTPREHEVLVASYAWYDSTQGCHRMPDSELAALAAKYQTTPVNIRKIRSRAKEKMEQYINSNHAERRNDAK